MITANEQCYMVLIAVCDACGYTKEVEQVDSEPTPLGWMRLGTDGMICERCQAKLLRELAVQQGFMSICARCEGSGYVDVDVDTPYNERCKCPVCGGAKMVIPESMVEIIVSRKDMSDERDSHHRTKYCSPFRPMYSRPADLDAPDPRRS